MLDKRSGSAVVLTVLALAMVSCGGEPANVAGTYTVALTNGANGCMFMNWTEGESTSGVELVITQEGGEMTADVTGLAGGYLDLVAGSSTFTGTISGTHLDGTLRGTARSMGSCAYTLNIDLDGELDGDVLVGDLRWYADTNDSPDCGMYATCESDQEFNGTRPPTP